MTTAAKRARKKENRRNSPQYIARRNAEEAKAKEDARERAEVDDFLGSPPGWTDEAQLVKGKD